MSTKCIEVKVFRYDPTKDIEPRYETFTIPQTENMTVLTALKYIYDNHSPIAFRYACRHKACGTCGVIVNGKPCLACTTEVIPRFTIEPLNGFPIIRDLAVDLSILYKRRTKIRAFLESKGGLDPKGDLISFDVIKEYSKFIECIHCGLCLAACPLVEKLGHKFAGPDIVIDLAREAHDPRDKGDRLGVAISEGVLRCDGCGKCVEVCPIKLPVFNIVYKYFREMAGQNPF